MTKVMLAGAIPEPPVILCRDEDAQLLMMHSLHEDWSRRPDIVILDSWPKAWASVNAAVVTPILVLGAEKATSFSIIGDFELVEEEREVLNAYINMMRSGGAGKVAYRDLTAATGKNRREITRIVKSLADKGVGTYKFAQGFSMDIGKWMPDAEKAKALGIKIKEY